MSTNNLNINANMEIMANDIYLFPNTKGFIFSVKVERTRDRVIHKITSCSTY